MKIASSICDLVCLFVQVLFPLMVLLDWAEVAGVLCPVQLLVGTEVDFIV